MKAKRVIVGACLGATLSAFAWDTFPNRLGTWDISDPLSWGASYTSETLAGVGVQFNNVSADYIVTRDVTFLDIHLSQSLTQSIRFVGDSRYTVSSNGDFLDDKGNTTTVFDGGNWNIAKELKVLSGGSDGTLILSNGVVVTTGKFLLGSGNARATLKVVDGSHMKVSGRGEIVTDGMTDCLVEVSGGSKYTWANGGYFQPAGNNCKDSVFLVSGTGSVVSNASTGGSSKMYDANSVGNLLRIEKGGLLDIRGEGTGDGHYAWGSGSCSNRFEIVGDGSRFRAKGLTFCRDYDSWGDSLLVADGGILDLKDGNLQVAGGGRHEVVVSNGTIRCGNFMIGTKATSVRNVFRAIGQQTKFETSTYSETPFGRGSFNEMVFDDVTYGVLTFQYGYNDELGSNNVLRVVNGSNLTLGRIIVGQYVGKSDNSGLYVTGGSTLTLTNDVSNYNNYPLQLSGANGFVVVSNATVNLTGRSQIGIGQPYASGDTGLCTNNWLVLQGTAPKIGGSKTRVSFANQSVFRIEVPKAGYGDLIPIEAEQFNMAADVGIEVECRAFQKTLWNGPTNVVIARVSSSFGSNTSTAIAAANERLARQLCSFSIDEKDLVLTIQPPKRGFIFYVQ